MAWEIQEQGSLAAVTAAVAAATGGSPVGGEVAIVETVKAALGLALGRLSAGTPDMVYAYGRGSGTNCTFRIVIGSA